MKSLVWQRNRHQKVYGGLYMCGVRGTLYRGLYICVVGLDIRKFEQTSLFCSDSCFNLGELGDLFRRGQAHQNPLPVVTGLCGKTSACFLMQVTRICQTFCL